MTVLLSKRALEKLVNPPFIGAVKGKLSGEEA
jgi:hypothetical protein